ncbi:MAG: zf-HC2 domain-containing protein [Polyangiaceae bacterium]|nr:zf-HC2 domain-containing protein [Polyangiaceae bacterium]
MDCEKFDLLVMDALYDDLDDSSMAEMKRHMDGCSRCATAFAGLKATREVAVLPLEEPSDELESRILFAASAAQKKTPWHKKALRGLAWAGSHAMRPQFAMAAVFVLVIGSSLLLLRAKPGATSLAPVRVTERGEPSPERDEGRGEAPLQAAPTAAAAAAAPAEAESGSEKQKEAKNDKANDDGKGYGGDAQTALADAKSVEAQQGCDAALAKYEDVGVRFAGTTQAADAMWAAAACHKKRGDVTRAREIYSVLEKREDYKEKAAEALNESSPMANMAGPQATAAPPAAVVANATAAPTAAKPDATPNAAPGGGGKSGAAAPVKAAPKGQSDAVGFSAPGGGSGNQKASPAKRSVIESTH